MVELIFVFMTKTKNVISMTFGVNTTVVGIYSALQLIVAYPLTYVAHY